MNKKVLSIVSAVLLAFACATDQKIIYRMKGFEEITKKRLKPMILETEDNVNGLVGLRMKNRLATINDAGEFSFVKIGDEGTATVEPIVPGFPGTFGREFISDDEHNLLWLIRGRGFYVLDIESKKTGHIITTNNGNAKINTTMFVDAEKKYFLIEIFPYPRPSAYILYDLNADKKIFTSQTYTGYLLPFGEKKMLLCDVIRQPFKKSIHKWHIVDSHFKKHKQNALTKKLTYFQTTPWPHSKVIHPGKRMMLVGGWGPGDTLIYYSARWDEKFKDVKVEPLIAQIPKRVVLHSDFCFSPDGNWIKTLANFEPGTRMVDAPELFIYHVGAGYPQGISLPIYCGYTRDGNSGAFLDHEKWGMCYVESDRNYPKKIFVYKLNDGLKMLADEAAEKMPGAGMLKK